MLRVVLHPACANVAHSRGRASPHSGHAISLDPCNPAFYGNRSLALERAARFEEALVDAFVETWLGFRLGLGLGLGPLVEA